MQHLYLMKLAVTQLVQNIAAILCVCCCKFSLIYSLILGVDVVQSENYSNCAPPKIYDYFAVHCYYLAL